MERVIRGSGRTKRYLIIPSGGSGVHIGTGLPKQYIKLGGKMILQHTVEAILLHTDFIILGTSYDYWVVIEDTTQRMCLADHIQLSIAGKTHFDTVRKTLRAVPDGTLVGIHDAVHSLASKTVVDKCHEEAQRISVAVPVLQLSKGLRYRPDKGARTQPSQAVDRSRCRLVRMPQVFQSECTKEAYQQPYQESFADGCFTYDQLYSDPALVPSTTENIKITTPDQLCWAEYLLTTSHQEHLRLTQRLLSSR